MPTRAYLNVQRSVIEYHVIDQVQNRMIQNIE